jgi:hypothetical protein
LKGLPDAVVGVPEIVIVPFDQVAETPVGSPLAPLIPSLLIPVAPVVVCVIVLIAVFKQADALPGPVTVLIAVIVIVPVAFTAPHPPVRRIL